MMLRHRQEYAAGLQIEQNIQEKRDRYADTHFPRRETTNTFEISGTLDALSLAESIVESSVHDTFLMMNIACPGSCNFYRASILGFKSIFEVSLSHMHFESARIILQNEGWSREWALPLDQVILWFSKVRSNASQVPQNPMERVLFALLHIAKIDMSPMIVIWLFFAFESLFQTRIGENFSSLVKRLSLLLGSNQQEASLLKKRMRELYDLRSAIVHGGFEVAHPMHAESLDDRLTSNFTKLNDIADFGFAVLLCCIQRTIERGWRFPIFQEGIIGERI
jgi:hypothetical protein